MTVASFLTTLSYPSLKKLSLKLLSSQCYHIHSTSPSLSIFVQFLLMEIKQHMQTPSACFWDVARRAMVVLSIHHPLCADKDAVWSRKRVFPATFKTVQQITMFRQH